MSPETNGLPLEMNVSSQRSSFLRDTGPWIGAFMIGAAAILGVAHKLKQHEISKLHDRIKSGTGITLKLGSYHNLPLSPTSLSYGGIPNDGRVLINIIETHSNAFDPTVSATPVYLSSDTGEIVVDGYQLAVRQATPDQLILQIVGYNSK